MPPEERSVERADVSRCCSVEGPAALLAGLAAERAPHRAVRAAVAHQRWLAGYPRAWSRTVLGDARGSR